MACFRVLNDHLCINAVAGPDEAKQSSVAVCTNVTRIFMIILVHTHTFEPSLICMHFVPTLHTIPHMVKWVSLQSLPFILFNITPPADVTEM